MQRGKTKGWQKLSHSDVKWTPRAESARIPRQTWLGWGCDGELRCGLWRLTQSGLTASAARSLNHSENTKQNSDSLKCHTPWFFFFLISVSPSAFSSPLFCPLRFRPASPNISGWLTAKLFSNPAKKFSCWGSLVSSLRNTNCLRRRNALLCFQDFKNVKKNVYVNSSTSRGKANQPPQLCKVQQNFYKRKFAT